MKFFHEQIAITGLSATGTTSTVAALKKRLPEAVYRFVSGGGIMRASIKHSRRPNATIEEYVAYIRKHPKLNADRKLDQMLNDFGTQNFGLLESRLAHVVWPGAFRVLIECPMSIRADRRARQLGISAKRAKQMIEQRDEDDWARYKSLYGPGCILNPSQFDFRINSGYDIPDDIAFKIMSEHQKWQRRHRGHLCTDVVCMDFALNMFKFRA